MTFLEAALAGDEHAAAAAGVDIVANSNDPDERTSAPGWLARLKEELEHASLAEVDIGARAKQAGAHPAHASRLFRRCYGHSITEHAQAQTVRRAIGPLASGASLSDVALAAGFYDQSHMSRVFKRVTGRTPGAHRALLMASAG